MLFIGVLSVVACHYMEMWNGLRGRKQQYKCKDCGRQFLGGIRRGKSQVISECIEGKQTRKQLAAKYGVSVRTIERDLEGLRRPFHFSRGVP